MSLDISAQFADWPYEPGQLSVRLIEGDDGKSKIQIRVDLGLLQLETEGRPDGKRPEGFESLLELCEAKLDEHVAAGNDPSSFTLNEDACKALRDEAVQYYHRYIALFALENFAGVARDTTRNLRVLDFCAEHAERAEDRASLEHFRPYLLMVRARAAANLAVRENEPKAAILAIEQAIEGIRQHYEHAEDAGSFEDSSEVQLLRGMREALAPRLPPSPKAELRERLKRAIEQENYELAAILRDELRMMPD